MVQCFIHAQGVVVSNQLSPNETADDPRECVRSHRHGSRTARTDHCTGGGKCANGRKASAERDLVPIRLACLTAIKAGRPRRHEETWPQDHTDVALWCAALGQPLPSLRASGHE
jgi:hypothetical protein